MARSYGPRSRAFRRLSRLNLTRLEERTQPSANYLPPKEFHINPDFEAVDSRLGQRPPLENALEYLNAHAAEFGATPADLVNPIVAKQYTDTDTGITHIYLRQRVHGLEVANASLGISVLANGSVFTVGGGFVSDLQSKLGARANVPAIDSLQAVEYAAVGLGLPWDSELTFTNSVYGPVKKFEISAPSLSTDVIPAQLHYVATPDGSAALAWDVVISTLDGQHWYNVSIDSMSGTIIAQSDWVDGGDEYNVVPVPNEHPLDGGTMVLTNPANTTASPFGWHDTNGVAGAEFTTTQGNNVDAHLDRDGNNSADASPPRPNGGAALDFSGFDFDPTLEPSALLNENSAVVNLFYMNNVIHDVYYQYGFTEAAGNFQTNNYGKGGLGNDALQADAQDNANGGSINNANMGTPGDGAAPRMQMFEWTYTTPRRDSDFDNGIIIHEYTHGLSNRLTDGSPNGLNEIQSGGMGEGWGDFYALMFAQRPTDNKNSGFGIGTYVIGQPITGGGIRGVPYSYSLAVNSANFSSYGTGAGQSTAVHATGELWCSALWDLNWLLIDKYGYDPNLSTGWSATAGPARAGNKLTMKLVMEGMKLQVSNPSFIQARDAIIAADIAINGGADLFEIWSAFARRGLGEGASTPNSSSEATPTLSSTVPMLVASVVPATGAVVTTQPANYVVNVASAIDPATLQASDLIVNGNAATGFSYTPGATSVTFTFTTDPVTAQGSQSILINTGAFTRSSDSSAVAKFTSNFFYDTTPLSVVSVSPFSGAKVSVPLTTVDVNLNGAVNPASVQNGDLSLTQGKVTGFTLLNSDTTVRFTLSSLDNEGTVGIYVAAGAFTDANGSPNSAFNGGTVTLDHSVFAFPTPLTARNPLGSMVYDGTLSANIGVAGDSDSFTLNLDAGQSLNVLVTPSTTTLRPSITVTGPGTNQTNSAPSTGATAQLQQIPITTAGTYTLAVTGAVATMGNYAMMATLNLAVESESNGGPTNNSLATAQNLDATLTSLGNGVARATIRGTSDAAATAEVEPNGTTGTATVITNASGQPTNLYQLGISGANANTTDSDYFNIGTMQVGDVITFTNSGNGSGRGTQTDALARIYRSGASGTPLISDDDSGPGLDGLIYRYTVTIADTYIIRALRATSADIGSYQLSVLLENTGTAPTTGGTFIVEVEPNDTATAPNNASTSWKSVKYDIGAVGTIAAGDTDLYSYQFTAGDVVSLFADSTSSLVPQSALLNSVGTVLATEDGTSTVAGAGGFSPIYGYNILTTGTYFFRVTGASGTTGSYAANVYRSTSGTLTVSPAGKDLYSMTLSAGQSASLALKNVTSGNLDISILDGGGATVATGLAGATNLDELVGSYTALTPGTYYAQVTGVANVNYDLVVVTGGTFDAEANDSFATAQSMGGNTAALGHIAAGTSDWYQLTLAAGNTLTVSTTTPGGDSGEFTNNLDPAIEIYNPSNVLVGDDDNSALDGRNATETIVAAVAGNYRVRVIGVPATSGEYVVKANVSTVAPPKVASLVIGDGTPQRSRVTTLKVNFDQAVTLPVNVEDAFTLTRQGGGSVTLDGVAVNSPNTTVTLTFVGGEVDFNSLKDGKYTLAIDSLQVTSPGGQLDGDGNGAGGDNYSLIGDVANGLFRFFGDFDGDGTTANNDFNQFRSSFGGTDDAFDFDNDGSVANFDFNQFRDHFGGSV